MTKRSPIAGKGVRRGGTAKWKSGVVWRRERGARNREVESVCQTLRREYGCPRLGNPRDPLDDLISVILSNKTGPQVAKKVYDELLHEFSNWDGVLKSPIKDLRRILKPAGLSTVKSWQIKGALRRIKKRFGACDLSSLRERPMPEVEAFLVSLPGVSEKVAKCVMMYTLSAKVLPVDVHVHRVSRRLGWTARKRADQCHQELEALVPPKWRHCFHVDCILHGRTICRPEAPACSKCCINRHCEYFRRKRSDG